MAPERFYKPSSHLDCFGTRYETCDRMGAEKKSKSDAESELGGLVPITDIIGSNRQKPAKDPTTSQTSAMTNGASCTRTFVAYLESKALCGMLARERTRDVRVQ